MQDNPKENSNDGGRDLTETDRRQFLSAVGKFSIVTPPTITLLLSTSLTSKAIAMSGGKGGNPGRGAGGVGGGFLQQLLNLINRLI